MSRERSSALIMGASSGIGAATATALSRAGHHVHVMARRGSELETLAAATGGTWASVDATDPDAVDDAVKRAFRDLPAPGLAVYAAGMLDVAGVDGHPIDLWRRTIDVNLNGAFFFARAVAPRLEAGSRIVFLSSVSGSKGQPNLSAYAASKGAVNRLAESLGAELEGRGIGVHVVAPGPVATPLLDRPGTSPFQLDPEQVAEVIVWLAGLPGDIVLRDVVVRAVTKGPFARRRHEGG
jgi:NAD(P)-dependent dehydrogenase (short-subunit alcohol dehydrogenase family)